MSLILVQVLFQSVYNLIIKLHELTVQQSMLSCINAGSLCYGLSITASTCPHYFLEIEIERDSFEI